MVGLLRLRRTDLCDAGPEGLTVLQELRTLVHRNEKAWLGSFSDPDLRRYIEQWHRIQDSLAALSEDAG